MKKMMLVLLIVVFAIPTVVMAQEEGYPIDYGYPVDENHPIDIPDAKCEADCWWCSSAECEEYKKKVKPPELPMPGNRDVELSNAIGSPVAIFDASPDAPAGSKTPFEHNDTLILAMVIIYGMAYLLME